METEIIRQKLHHLINTVEDKKVAAIYTLLETEINLDDQRKNLIKAERENHFKGIGKVYDWSEIKAMALDKEKRHAL